MIWHPSTQPWPRGLTTPRPGPSRGCPTRRLSLSRHEWILMALGLVSILVCIPEFLLLCDGSSNFSLPAPFSCWAFVRWKPLKERNKFGSMEKPAPWFFECPVHDEHIPGQSILHGWHAQQHSHVVRFGSSRKATNPPMEKNPSGTRRFADESMRNVAKEKRRECKSALK